MMSQQVVVNESSNDVSDTHISLKTATNYTSVEYKNTSEIISSVSELFKGFTTNEICQMLGYIKNVNLMHDTLDSLCRQSYISMGQNINAGEQKKSSRSQSSLKLKWYDASHPLCRSNSYLVPSSCQHSFLKPMANKCLQLSTTKTNNGNKCNLTDISHALNENTYNNEAAWNKLDKSDIINMETKKVDNAFIKVEMKHNYCQFSHLKVIDQEINNYNNDLISEDKKLLTAGTLKQFEQEVKLMRQAIQNDTYKMDFVCYNDNDQNVIIDLQKYKSNPFITDNLIVNQRLGTSVRNFLKRVNQEASIESSTLSFWKSATIQKDLKDDSRLEFSMSNYENFGLLGNLDRDRDINNVKLENIKNPTMKTSLSVINSSPKVRQYDTAQLQMVQDTLDSKPDKAEAGVDYEKTDETKNISIKCTVNGTEQTNGNSLQHAASITELATFKKQYYDTLLSIQKAKVAVANSLVMSPMESSMRYDPCYSNYSYQQQQQLLQQQGQLIVSPQFSMHTIAQSGLSNMHGAPYSWVRYSNWRYPLVRQLRFQRQTPSFYSKNKNNCKPRFAKTMNVQCFMQTDNKQAKQCVQRMKLEDIVGKLKEVENDNINN